jgi:hypothetical protein
MTGASLARSYMRGGGAEDRLVSVTLPSAGNIFFEEDRALSGWEPFEPEKESISAFSQLGSARALLAPDEMAAHCEGSDAGEECLPDKFAATDMVWPVEGLVTEELVRSHALDIQEMEERHRQELEEQQSRLTQNMSQGFADAVCAIEKRVSDELMTRLASLLAPLLTEHAQRTSVAAVVEELRSLVLSGKMTSVKMSGPASMVSKIKEAMGGAGDRITIGEERSPDVVVEVDSQIISTRLAEWSESLRAALS